VDGSDERLIFLTDANMNVTTLVDTSGDAVEQYVYDLPSLKLRRAGAYGEVTIYDDDWSDTRTSSSYDNTTRKVLPSRIRLLYGALLSVAKLPRWCSSCEMLEATRVGTTRAQIFIRLLAAGSLVGPESQSEV